MHPNTQNTVFVNIVQKTIAVAVCQYVRQLYGLLIHKANGPPTPTPPHPTLDAFLLELTQPLQTAAI